MKDTNKKNPKEEMQAKQENNDSIIFNELFNALLNQQNELSEDVFLTKEDKKLIGKLSDKHNKLVQDALLKKGMLFQKLVVKFQRLNADYANYQKRAPKQIADSVAYQKENILKTLLPVLDNFEHTLQNAHTAEDADILIKGIEIVYDQMLNVIKSHGVEQVKALGEKFNPAMHQAMMQRSEADQQEDIVLEELQKGYELNGRVIRPSKVIVNKAPAKQQPDVQEQATDKKEEAE